MPIELWNTEREVVIPALRFGIITPGTDVVKSFSVKNDSLGDAKWVRLGAIPTSNKPEGGNMLFENGWIFAKKSTDGAWIPLGLDFINESLDIGTVLAGDVISIDMKLTVPGPKVITSQNKCSNTGFTVYDITLPSEFLLKLMMSQI